jgi:hypothetical protein
MLPRAYVVHRLGGRMRLKVPEKRKDAQWLAETAERLERLAGVEGVQTAPMTGSLLIHCEDSGELEELVSQSKLFQLTPGPIPKRPALEPLVRGVAHSDHKTERHTLGGGDLRTLLSLVFVALAIVQLVRGQIWVPAISLLWYAATLALGPVGQNGNDSPDAPASSE